MLFDYDHGLAAGFVHKRIGGFVRSFLPAPVQIGLDLVGVGGGGGGAGGEGRRAQKRRDLAASFSVAELRRVAAHVGHGHVQSTDKHAFLTNARIDAARARGITAGPACSPPNTEMGPDGICRIPLIDADPNVFSPAERAGFQGEAVAGAFGIPAMVPEAQSRTRLSCPPGMVLGRDNLCYPKQVLRRDSRFRKWRPGVRPILTGGERNAIRKAKRAIIKGRDAISGLGITVKKN